MVSGVFILAQAVSIFLVAIKFLEIWKGTHGAKFIAAKACHIGMLSQCFSTVSAMILKDTIAEQFGEVFGALFGILLWHYIKCKCLRLPENPVEAQKAPAQQNNNAERDDRDRDHGRRRDEQPRRRDVDRDHRRRD